MSLLSFGANYDYDLAVIGAGSAGLTAAGISGSLGARTLLIEADKFGGDCTWTGCVPSKTLLAEAKKIHTASQATGTYAGELSDFSRIMKKVRSVREGIYEEADSPEVLRRFGVQTISAQAEFADKHTLQLSEAKTSETVTAKYIFIATGASPSLPPITGLEDTPYRTSDTLFEIKQQPEAMIIVGAGPIGVEMSQAFARLGTTVQLLESGDSILPTQSPLTKRLQNILQEDGVQVHNGARAKKITESGERITVQTDLGDEFSGDELLMATGRRPNISGLNLSEVDVAVSNSGIKTDDYGRTSVGSIYAIGDVTGGPQFTHQSEQKAKLAVFRALFKLPLSSKNPVPRVTYTDPEYAVVGQSADQLEAANIEYDVYEFPYEKLDRAITDGKENGGIRLIAQKDNTTLLGAEVLGSRAGELISELSLAIANNLSVRDIAETVHPYPSYGLGVRRAADQYMVQNQPTWLLKIAKKLFGYRGSLYEPEDGEIV